MKTPKNPLNHSDEFVQNYFPDFPYSAEELSAFHLSLTSFVISLKSREIVRFTPKDTKAFLQWLLKHKVRDVR